MANWFDQMGFIGLDWLHAPCARETHLVYQGSLKISILQPFETWMAFSTPKQSWKPPFTICNVQVFSCKDPC